MNSEAKGLRLLALDGGGIRGLSELLILGELMERIKFEEGLDKVPKPCEYFDLIGGTGTGGIIAILLGRLGMSVQEATDVYVKLARRVFSSKKYLWQDGMFKASALEEEMKDIVARYDRSQDKDLRMRDRRDQRRCKTFVCAIPAQNMAHPRLFRSYEVREGQEHDATIWEVARATSAASQFFKRIFIGTDPKEEFVDGGLRFNNPTKEVLREAQNLCGMDYPISCILSVGTGHPNAIALHEPNIFEKVFPKTLMRALEDIAADCEKVSDEFETEYGEGNIRKSKGEKKTYFRLNVQQGLQGVSLTEWDKMGDVKAHTNQYMRNAEVNEKMNKVVNVLRARRMQEEEEPQLT